MPPPEDANERNNNNNNNNTDKCNSHSIEEVEQEIISVGVPDIISANSNVKIVADANNSSSSNTSGNLESSATRPNASASSAAISGTALGRRLHGNYRYAGILPHQPRSFSSR